MNPEAARRMGWVLAQMRREGTRRDAPVLRLEAGTLESPFRALVFTMLSARTKDETTMKVGSRLFRVADTPKVIRALGRKRLEKLLYGIGFYHEKSKHLLQLCEHLEAAGYDGGRVPGTLEGLLALPGVGRKTANIVLARAFGKDTLGVDVHVHRISNRLGLVRTKKPEETEKALLRIIPAKYVRPLNRNFVAFGQTLCLPRRPMCGACPLNRICRRVGVKEPCARCAFGKK
jgi:endonuclease III